MTEVSAGTPAETPSGTPRPGTAGAPATNGPARRPEPATGTAHQQARSNQAMIVRHDRVARRLAAACDMGDTAALQAVLAADAMVVSDGGGKLRAAVRPTYGADAVARPVTDVWIVLNPDKLQRWHRP
ncbi:hypothetical protein [Nonomuraea sp. CA-141351]|uniref:hypothetical protein n=1 Tax=Nonomuraea sp. CA-141351 TaxID=3239996 RepID=UPI003D90C50D